MINIQLASEDWVNSGKTWENVVNTVKTIKYGDLYNWYAATDSRGICGSNAHLPSYDEFNNLLIYLGYISGDGFNATPGGWRFYDGSFQSIGLLGFYKISTSNGDNNYVAYIDYSSGVSGAFTIDSENHVNGSYIRLIIDTPIEINGNNAIYVGNDLTRYNCVLINGIWWLAENLVETKYKDGSIIPTVTDNTEWSGLTTGAVCAYNNDESNVYDIVSTPDPTHIEPILSKMVYVNAVDFKSLVEYPDNATAISAGLTVGQLYTTTGSLKIVYSIAP